MSELKAHPAADLFPMLDPERYQTLRESIRANGLRHPIVLCDGMLLDGRNRAKACAELGIEPTTITFDGDPWEYAWDSNAERRDLDAERRAAIWLEKVAQQEAWQGEVRRRQAEANRARAEAAREQIAQQSRDVAGRVEPGASTRSGQTRTQRGQGTAAAANASRTNRGAIERQTELRTKRPDLAEQVRAGELSAAAARREMKRSEQREKLESLAAAEVAAPTGVYDVIVIDPPWQIEKIERDERPNQVGLDYPTMSEEEIAALDLPCADDCHVWCWTTHRYLPATLRILAAWKLKYVCTFTWHKPGGFQPVGLPQYNSEFAVYARRGSPAFIDTKAFPVCFTAARGRHSEKPAEFYDLVRRVTAGRRLDMFNRRPIEGFAGWGNEAA